MNSENGAWTHMISSEDPSRLLQGQSQIRDGSEFKSSLRIRMEFKGKVIEREQGIFEADTS